MQYLLLNNPYTCMCLCSDTNWICKYLAIVRISQPAAFRSGTCNTLRIPESDRKKQQNAFPTAYYHALRNRNRTGRKNNRSCKSLPGRLSSIPCRRTSADHRSSADGKMCIRDRFSIIVAWKGKKKRVFRTEKHK